MSAPSKHEIHCAAQLLPAGMILPCRHSRSSIGSIFLLVQELVQGGSGAVHVTDEVVHGWKQEV